MDESPKEYRVSPGGATSLLAYLLTYSTLASGSLAGLLYASGLLSCLPIWAMIALAPIFYLAWLVLFLAWGYLVGIPFYAWIHRCPNRLSTCGDGRQGAQFATQMSLYLKCVMLQTLPLARPLQMLPYWNQLVFRGYAPRNKIGRDAQVWGLLWDPDITEIGDLSIIGANTHVCCHSVAIQPDGSQSYHRAPVVIGRRVTIAGDCRIDLGVTIGDDSILEAGSTVAPFTAIPAGQVWGGSPARFIRCRFNDSAETSKTSCGAQSGVANAPAANEELQLCVRQLIAGSLNLDVAQVPADASMSSLSEWDSLGQMGVAAGIHSRFGIDVRGADMFRLRSVADVVDFVQRSREAADPQPDSDDALPKDPELLPLWDHDRATRVLARQLDRLPQPTGEPIRVVIAATFTAESLGETLKLWGRSFGLTLSVEFAGFNQVVQELLSPGSLFHANGTGLNVVLTRPEDLLGEERACSVQDLLNAVATFAKQANGTLVVGSLPPIVSKIAHLDRGEVDELRALWAKGLAELTDVALLDFAGAIEQVGIAAAGQTDDEVISRSPYSAKIYQELGILLARLVRQRRVAPAKVVAIDADGVLWGGVVAEDGLQGIQLGTDHPGRSFRLFQQYLKSLKANGQLLVLVSRNQPEDVWRVFDEHPEMVLHREDFAGARINWAPKSQNVKELAQELNLGLDAFVFLDDDAANRLEMAANAPGATVVPLPTDAAQYVPLVSRLWRFDAPVRTAEDRSRTQMMQQEQQRQRLLVTTGDLQSYLRSLSLRVVMREANDVDLPRVAQLTQKTNQFNLSLKRRSISELRMLDERFQIFAVEASDRFGDYGLVGVCILESPIQADHPFHLDTLLMSCRVLGRGVEDAILYGLTCLIESAGGQRLEAPLVVGPRNQPIVEFLTRSGFQSGDGLNYQLNLASGVRLPEHVDWQGPGCEAANAGNVTRRRQERSVAA